MSKSETEIARENIKYCKESSKEEDKHNFCCEIVRIETHKTTCQRFLEFLNHQEYDWTTESKEGIISKVLDLKSAISAIKLYEDNGI